MIVLALTALACTSAVAAWLLDQRRSRQRNTRGECGACGSAWADTPSGDPYLIHGRLVCEVCAEKARRRMPWELGTLAGWAALIAAVFTSNVLVGNQLAVTAFSIIAVAILVPVGAVQLMKLANRRAQRRIAAGEFPDFKALGAGVDPDEDVDPADGLP